MKIINTDNYDRDNHSDILIAENITSVTFAKFIADSLNQKYGGENSSNFFKAVEDDYKLYTFEP